MLAALLEVPAEGVSVVLLTPVELPVLVAAGAQGEGGLGARVGEERGEEAVRAVALLVELAGPHAYHLHRRQRSEEPDRYAGQLPVAGEVEALQEAQTGGVNVQCLQGVEGAQVEVGQIR